MMMARSFEGQERNGKERGMKGKFTLARTKRVDRWDCCKGWRRIGAEWRRRVPPGGERGGNECISMLFSRSHSCQPFHTRRYASVADRECRGGPLARMVHVGFENI